MALRAVWNQFLDVFSKLTLVQRIAIGASAVAVLSTLIVLVVWANKPVYRTLYTELVPEDTNKIMEKLKEQQVPYKLEGGDTITVPQEYVYQTRLEMAKFGLPVGGGTGFELFDKNQFGMTEFMQDVNYQRAMQGELARTIQQLDEVKEAKVHLTVPKERLFVESDDRAKASVVLRMKEGNRLKQQQIQAIAFMVAGSVKGLTPENVQILNTAGELLTDFMRDDRRSLVLSETQHDYQLKVERDIESKLNTMLSRTLGDGRSIAKVTVEMDFAKKETVSEEYGDSPVIRSSHALEINSKNTPKGPQGIPGVESNLAEPNILGNETLSEYNKAEETSNYEINKTVTKETRNHGVIKRLTVAVVVDDRVEVRESGGKFTEHRTPRNEEEMARIKNIVAMASGVNQARGDALEVSNISFDTTMETQETRLLEKERMTELVADAIKYGSALALLVVFYLLILRPVLRRIDRAQDVDDALLGETAFEAQMQSLDITVGDETGFPKSINELEREIEAELEESTPVDVETVKSKVMLKKIVEATNEDPEMIANLVKALIKGG